MPERVTKCLHAISRKRGRSLTALAVDAGLSKNYARKLDDDSAVWRLFSELISKGTPPWEIFLPPVSWHEDADLHHPPVNPWLERPTLDEATDWMAGLRGKKPQRDDPMLEYCNVFCLPGQSLKIRVLAVGRLSMSAIAAGVYTPRHMERVILNSPIEGVYDALAEHMRSLKDGDVERMESRYQTVYVPPDLFQNFATTTVKSRCDDWIINFAESTMLSKRRDPSNPFSGNPLAAVVSTRSLERL